MDVKSTPERHGRPRPPSVFDTLMTLCPPSPILSASLSISFSSEEIPILLFDPSLSESDLADTENVVHVDDRTSVHTLGIPSSNSAGTIGSLGTVRTVGTFGPYWKTSKRISSYDFVPEGQEMQIETVQEVPENDIGPSTADQLYTQELETHLDSEETPPVTEGFSTTPSDCYVPSPPSPSPSVYSTLSYSSVPSTVRKEAPSEPRPLSCFSHSSNISRHNATKLPHDITKTTRSGDSASRPASLVISKQLIPQDINRLSKDLEWLRNITIDMLIDQEGFRAVSPKFRFSGYSTSPRVLGNGLEISGGVVEFIPVSRQTFHFHYAPFEGQPVLRRLTINGEPRDFISRQATLSIKSNGVYTVNGAETCVFEKKTSHTPEDTKLRWSLEYFVDAKRGPRALEGEKNFTPLAFCCSPLLLHPLQGKKIRLMHVVKKSVVTKLVAEKMEPPRLSSPKSSPSIAHPSPHSTASPKPVRTQQFPLAQIMNDVRPSIFHRRRASSGGEEKRRVNVETGTPKLRPASGSGWKFRGHILPPSKLSELLDRDDEENMSPAREVRALQPPPRNIARI